LGILNKYFTPTFYFVLTRKWMSFRPEGEIFHTMIYQISHTIKIEFEMTFNFIWIKAFKEYFSIQNYG
jgi:hypothetical protein